MIQFQGKIFNNREEMNNYINSQITEITTDTERLANELQKYFDCKLTDVRLTNNIKDTVMYKAYFKTKHNTVIEQIFSDDMDIQEIKMELQNKINKMNEIITSVKKLGIYEIQCKQIKEFSEFQNRLQNKYEFEFRIHKHDEVITKTLYKNDSIDDIINFFKQYIVTELEGVCTVYNWDGCEMDAYNIDVPMKINGIHVNGLLKQAIIQHKNVKLEII